jgi:hypothetical protein
MFSNIRNKNKQNIYNEKIDILYILLKKLLHDLLFLIKIKKNKFLVFKI